MLFPKNPYLSLLISFLLLPITFIYFIVVAFRHILYDSGIIKSFKPNVFTVSIGNITVGGTGKTPTVINMVNSLSVSGLNPLIVTRGYGRKTKCRVVLNETTSASDSGDEALTIYRKTKKSVVCDINRSSAIKDMGKYYDLIVLDDAFQHRKVKKDLDIVLIDESRFLGNHLLLPSGILRDRISRLYDCDLIVLSKVKDIHSESVKEKFNYLKRFKKNIIISKLTYNSISNGNSSIEFEKISGMKISLFCGVGNPKDFFDIFSKYTIAGLKAFPDHCKYENNFFELKKIKKEADILITTYKDFVKLGETTINELNIYYLDIDLKFYDQGLKEISLSDLIGERVFEKK